VVSEIGKSQPCTIIDLVHQVSSIVGDKSKESSLETDPSDSERELRSPRASELGRSLEIKEKIVGSSRTLQGQKA
jgi:hypothetical protein